MTTDVSMRKVAGDLAYQFPVSAQQRRWIAALEAGTAPLPPLWVEIDIAGLLCAEQAAGCFERLILRHEALRTIVRPIAGSWQQIVFERPAQVLACTHALAGQTRPALVGNMRRSLYDQILHRDADALFQGALLSFSPEEHVLIFVAHPLICDLPSLDLLVREFAQLYDLSTERQASLPPVELQYADYTAWQELNSRALPAGAAAGRSAWRAALQPMPHAASSLHSVERRIPNPLLAEELPALQSWALDKLRQLPYPDGDAVVALSRSERTDKALAGVVGPLSSLLPIVPEPVAAEENQCAGQPSLPHPGFEWWVGEIEREFRLGRLALPAAAYIRPAPQPLRLASGTTLSYQTSPFSSCDALVSADFNFGEEGLVIRLTSSVVGTEELRTLANSLEPAPVAAAAEENRPSQALTSVPNAVAASAASGAPGVHLTTDTQTKLAEIWSEVLHVEDLRAEDDFFDLGGHSLLAVKIISKVERAFGIEISLNSVLEYSRLSAFAQRIDAIRDRGEEAPQESLHRLVPIQPEGANAPLYWVPGGRAGSVVALREVSMQLGQVRPVFGLESAAPKPGEGYLSVEERARAYVELIRAHQPHGPYCVAGFCLGGMVAFEIAQQLRQAGEAVQFVGLVQAFLPIPTHHKWHQLRISWQRHVYIASIFSRFALMRAFSFALPHARRQALLDQMAALLLGWVSSSAQLPDDPHVRNLETMSHYQPQPYAGKVCLFLAKDCYESIGLTPAVDPRQTWRKFAAEAHVTVVPGNHSSILEIPQARSLAEAMQNCIGC
jgi:thioesterase domain-containing protein/acyl carrier protein